MKSMPPQISRFHRDQSGAVALLVLAALLAMLMLALVVFDTGQAARDKMSVQQAADTAAWSEAAVEARAMNMLAFSNVAKRVTIGMTSFYEALWRAYGQLAVVAAAATAAACVAAFFTGGALAQICEKMIEFCVELATIMGGEASDGAAMANDLNAGYFKDDVIALDNYQTYMSQLAPWWAYAEGIQRGIRNGASISASFPVPESNFPGINIPLTVGSFDFNGTGISATLPVERAPEDAATDLMCDRVGSKLEYFTHGIDYVAKNFENAKKNWKTVIIYGLTDALALLQLKSACRSQMQLYGEAGRPWRMRKFDNAADWMLHSSNLTFAYLPDAERMQSAKERLDFMPRSYTHRRPLADTLHSSGGYWAMARSEISYQNGTPDLWHPSWSVRMRPVAIPGEWTQNGISLGRALNDVLPALAFGAGIDKLAEGELDLKAEGADLVRIFMSAQSFSSDGSNATIEGLSK